MADLWPPCVPRVYTFNQKYVFTSIFTPGEESSDIEIEEEYIEENGKLIRVDGEDMYEDDDDGVNKGKIYDGKY